MSNLNPSVIMANHPLQDFMNASSTDNEKPPQPPEGIAKKLHGWQKLPVDRIEPKELIKAVYPEQEGQG
ncbi:MAG: hypothetical protein ACRD72_11365 [Candidatus Angelobacter sp.]